MISNSIAKQVGHILGIDFKSYPLKLWTKAMNIELEHGSSSGNSITNVTNDDLLLTGKIALAHILEYPDYYQRLIKMEKEAKKFWKGVPRKRILKL